MSTESVTVPTSVQKQLRDAQHVVVFTGAGRSADSGVPTFRGADGMWRNHRPEDLATPEAFQRDPQTVWEWYDWRRSLIFEAQPNAAHTSIAAMERAYPRCTVITQNVDGLHQLGGCEEVVELHGNIWRLHCVSCGDEQEVRQAHLEPLPPRCTECNGLLRPGVVWFGETLPHRALVATDEAMRACDVLLVIGTSAVVYPAAAFPPMAKQNGAFVIEINPDATALSPNVDVAFAGKAAEVMPALLAYVPEAPHA